MSPANDDYVKGKEAIVKIFNGGNCNSLHNEKILHNKSGQTLKRYSERLNISILRDIQNSECALATCSNVLSRKLDKVTSGGPFQLTQVYDSIEVMTLLNLKKYFHTYQKI